MQTGCAANEKCTWITDQEIPTEIGHIGCTPDGTVQIGDSCKEGPPGPNGFDDCAKGGICVGYSRSTDSPGQCKVICDPQFVGLESGCDENHSCSRYFNLFKVAGMTVAGACDPKCDVLTQDLLVAGPNGRVTACGSEDPAAPRSGCYQTARFQGGSCAPVRADGDPERPPGEPEHLDRTDRQIPRRDAASGTAFLNGCAPGYTAFFFEMPGSMVSLCTGFCKPVPGGLSNANNPTPNTGDGNAIAKLPREPAPGFFNGVEAPNTATCNPNGAKGSVAVNGTIGTEQCVYLWPFLADNTGAPDPEDTKGEDLGFCFPFQHFTYDSDNDGVRDTSFPDFSTLPPPTDGVASTFPTAFLDTCDAVALSDIGTCTKAQAGFANVSKKTPAKQGPRPMKMFRLGNIDPNDGTGFKSRH